MITWEAISDEFSKGVKLKSQEVARAYTC